MTRRVVNPLCRGFTLIELAVTIVILGILVGLGGLSYVFLQNAGNNTSAKETLQRVVTTQQSVAYDWGRYSPYGPDVAAAGSDISFVSGATIPDSVSQVSLGVGAVDGQSASGWLGLATVSPSGECVTAVLAPASDGSQPVFEFYPADSAPCTGQEALSVFFDSAVVLAPEQSVKNLL